MATILTNFSNIVVFFVVFIIPLWLFLHYTIHNKAAKLSSDDKARIEVLQHKTQQLIERVEILETILDDKVPDWRQINDD